MMKFVVLAMALTAVSAGTVFTGLPLTHGALAYSGLPLTTSGLPLATSGLPLATSGLPLANPHFAAPISQVVPTTYVAGAAPALVQPSPYQIHTGVRAEVAVEPVEQHGYVIKY